MVLHNNSTLAFSNLEMLDYCFIIILLSIFQMFNHFSGLSFHYLFPHINSNTNRLNVSHYSLRHLTNRHQTWKTRPVEKRIKYKFWSL